MLSSLPDDIVPIAKDKTAVVAALGRVNIGSIASSKTSTGATGNSKDNSAKEIVGTSATPLKPAVEIPVILPNINTCKSMDGVKLTSNKLSAKTNAMMLYIILPILVTNKLREVDTSEWYMFLFIMDIASTIAG